MGSRANRIGVTWELVATLAGELPEAMEGTSYGTPAFFRGKRLFVRFHQSGEAVVVNQSFEDRDEWMASDPESFFITDHYVKYPYMLVRLATVNQSDMKVLIEESWRRAGMPTLRNAARRRK